MRIVCISDTHHGLPEIPEGDVLIHAGDLTMEGGEKAVVDALEEMAAQPHTHKIVVSGNHDFWFQTKDRRREIEDRFPEIVYLQDGAVILEGLSFYGSPWQPWFQDWAFNKPRDELAEIWALIPEETNILITHGPPMGILDRIPSGEAIGCAALLARVKALPNLELHVFGHVHSGYGREQAFGIEFVNAAICDESYRHAHDPIVIDL